MTFNKIYEKSEQNVNIFMKEIEWQMTSLMQGQDTSLLIYGSEKSGKNHSLFGTVNDNGILVLLINTLYKHLDLSEGESSLWLSLTEYKQNGFFDLLTPTDIPL
jgi:hypothetical protein